jgi:hypothetical protein
MGTRTLRRHEVQSIGHFVLNVEIVLPPYQWPEEGADCGRFFMDKER